MSLHADQSTDVITRFNLAFQQYTPDALPALLAEHCVLENTSAGPNGLRHVGRAACLAVWQAIAADRGGRFELEEVIALGDTTLIYWCYHRISPASSTRGVNIMRVQDGLIVDARGYVKAG
ncbi:Ketosteroid isomerase-related protein [Andreprevotia lacus DSM 23236]|jgi:ketosteroid isomerase-like protein|uniref:Ketosteroid isomerase-related protein n=1 Tax=Andreprevotia lacus DSM 23236 TaxID=1121001 RepID=A0A1W1Y180_9NEIS|nr:nuclear transport factor 2 family protein [Andreprevotia lacus]SMC29884.1 Ketosteroid isomerase-related protein [Andreprevotia lacus DSM 23236]